MRTLLRLQSNRPVVLAAIGILAFSQLNVGAGQASSSNATQTGVSGPASSLVGLTEAQVRSALGAISGSRSGTWYFDSAVGTLTVFFKNGLVSEVNPPDFELGVLAARTPAERAAFVEAVKAKAEAERKRKEAEAAIARAKEEADAATGRVKAEAERKSKEAEAEAERRREEAEPLVRVTESQARALLSNAAKQANNDVDAFTTSVMLALKPIAPAFNGLQYVEESGALDIFVTGPLFRLFADLRERVRKFEPLVPRSVWSPEIHIVVDPKQISSPDIERIIVQRNGKVVPALRTTLAVRQMVTPIGAKRMIHDGVVVYPPSAFEPGAGVAVTITAIPASGSNVTRTFGSFDLRGIQ